VVPADDLVRRLGEQLASAPPEIQCAYLYGSVARGPSGAGSDVDLGVLLAARPPATLQGRMLDHEAALERALGRPVQLVVLNDAPADLVHRVLRDGRVVLDRDRSARIQFEVRARNEYFDLLPILRRYRAAALREASARP
jgi:predicted nucleotidyltransferase